MNRAPLLLLLASVGCSGSTESDPTGVGGGAGGVGGVGGVGAGGSGGGSGGSCSKLCGNQCVSTSDPAFGCGSASCTPCNVPHAAAACSPSGECLIGTCDNGFADCDGDTFIAVTTGCETNIVGDPTNCGGCGIGCTSSGGSVVCVGGNCQGNTCPSGQADCSGQGTCTSLETNENCGYCGNACTFPNASGACKPSPGALQPCVYECNAGYSDCDGLPANGCETPSPSC